MSELVHVHLAHLRAGGYSKVTVDSAERLLLHADDYLPYGLDEAHPDELADYLAHPDWSAWTRSTYWSHLDRFYNWAVRNDELDINPMHRLIRPKAGESVPHPVTDAELAAAIANSPDQPWRLAVYLAAYAGLRASEICRLRREDCTPDSITIRAGKGGRDAHVPMHPLLWPQVQHRLSGTLVRQVCGKEITGSALSNRQHKHWRRIGLPDVHLHRFRHWYGTALLRGGADLRTVQELMRHRSIVSTQGYTLVVSEQRTIAIRTLPAPATSPLKSAAA